MILYLINYLELDLISNLFSYLTVRTGLSLITSFLLIIIFGPFFIRKISTFQTEGQPIRVDGPQSHIIAKKGTPTMGGIIILTSIIISIIFWCNPDSTITWPVVFVMTSFGLIGPIVSAWTL